MKYLRLLSVFSIIGVFALFPMDSAAADNEWQSVANGNVSGNSVQFDWRGGNATYVTNVADGSTVSVTINNTIANCIGNCTPKPDRWSVNINGTVFSGDTIEMRTVEVTASGQVTIALWGIDSGFWGGWYGPIFTISVTSAPLASPSPTASVSPTPEPSPSSTPSPSATPTPDPISTPSPTPTSSPEPSPVETSPAPTQTPSLEPPVVNSVNGSADENGQLSLSAPIGKIFTSVIFASYGTPDGYSLGQCHATNSVEKVAEVFLGKAIAMIMATNDVFGDPCGGVYKRLAISLGFGDATPEPQPTLEPSPSPTPTLEPVVEQTPQPQPTQEPAPSTPEPTPSPTRSPAIEPTPAPGPAEVPAVEPSPEPSPVEPSPSPEESEPTPAPTDSTDQPATPSDDTPQPDVTPDPVPVVEVPKDPQPTPSDAPDTTQPQPEPSPQPTEESNSNSPSKPLIPGLIPNNPDSLPDDIPKLPEPQALKPHIQVDKPGVENGGIEFYGTKTQPQVIGEDGQLTPPPPAPGSGDPIPPDAITTTDTFIGQPGGTTFNAPDIAVPVLPIEINIDIPGVGESVQALANAYVAMANIGNDMSPITRKKAKKILIATLVAGQISQLRRRF